MQRHELIAQLGQLKLHGMASAFDEAVIQGVRRQLTVQEILARLCQAEVAENVTARFLTEGAFQHPADGVTIYIREISPRGELLDLFLSDARSTVERTAALTPPLPA